MKKVSVSFLTSKNTKNDLIRIDNSNADYIHVDVMDGIFVKKRKNPFKKISKISNELNKRLDVHLMVKNPLKNINYYASLNTEYITVHVELKEVDKYLDLIKNYGIKCGLAINPDTDVSVLLPYLDKVDLIIVMGVYPGEGGQTFINGTTNKILKIKKMIESKKSKTKISIDGGVNDETSKLLLFADILVSGSYALKGDINKNIEILKNNAE